MAATTGTASLVTQPAFASQILNLPSPVGMGNTNGAGSALQRGYMVWANSMPTLYSGGGALGDGRDVIRFLFNPSTVNSQYNVGNASLQAAMMYPVPGDSGNLLAPLLTQTVAWELFFDRTFELNYGGQSTSENDPGVIGVQADVYAFMQFTGVLATLSKQDATAVLGTPTGGSAPTTGGIMMMIPAYVYFGNASQQYSNTGTVDANNTAVGQQLAYYGFISGWSVNYTHFTVNMVPIRCTVDVSFTMLPNPTAAAGTATWNDVQKLRGQYAPLPPQGPNTPGGLTNLPGT